MLQYKKTFLRYNNLCTLMSFNANAINKSIFNIRNKIRYIFFYLIKKTLFLKLLFLYKLFFFIIIFKRILKVNIQSLYNYLFKKLFKLNNFLIKDYYYLNYLLSPLNFTINKNNIYLNNILNINNVIVKNESSIIFYYNYFYYLYKTFIFIVYIWLYSVKYFNFYKLNISNIPINNKLFTVLKSPHKDKTSREKFKISKIKKNMLFPTFFGNNIFFLNILNESISIQYKINKKK